MQITPLDLRDYELIKLAQGCPQIRIKKLVTLLSASKRCLTIVQEADVTVKSATLAHTR